MSFALSKFVGDQLRLARLTHGMSLEEVAGAVGASRQYVHQLETGARSPGEDLISALAAVLGIKEDFLFNGEAAGVRPEHCHFRRQQTTPVSIISQVLARGTMIDRLVRALDRHLGLPPVNIPDVPVVSGNDIERAAEHARAHWRLGEGPITNMMRVVENAGAVVIHFPDLSERVDALSMDRPRPIVIRSDAKASLVRLRFDLAHELGHLIMHRGIETGDKVTEGQAHRFAGAFLFPRSAFLAEFPRGRSMNWAKLFELKLRWKISVRAMIRRAYDLGVIDAAQYRSANIQIVKLGQAKSERYDDTLPLEETELLNTALEALEASSPDAIYRLLLELELAPAMYRLLTHRDLPLLANLGPDVVRLTDFHTR